MSADVASGVPSEAGSSNERLLNNNHVAATSALESASERKSPEACSDELQLSESEAAEDRLPAHLQVLSGLCSAGPLALPGLNLLNATEYLRNMYAAAAVRNLQQECKRSPGDVIAALPQLAYLSFCGQNPLGSSVAEHTKELLSPPCLSKESSATKVSSASDDKFPCSPVFPSVSVKRQFSNALHNSAAAVKNEAAAAAAEATHDTKRHNSCSQLSPQTPRDSGSVNASSNANADVKTFREQFKQLYEASEDPKRREFLDDLFTFMQKRGTPINRIPIMAKSTLDLYELFRLVVSKGGLVEVINKKLWREITKGLNLPSSITSAAFTLRTQYMKFLYPYECERLKLSTPQELQAAIDGNRREGHSARSSLPSGASASNCASPSGKLGQTCVFAATMTSNNNDCSSNKSQEDAPEEVCEPFDECSLGESVADEQDFGEVGNANPFDASSCMQQPVSSLMQAILSSQRAGKLPLADDGALAPQRLALSNMQLALPPSPQKRARCAAAAEQADGNKLIKVSVEISGTVYRGVLFKE